MRIDAVIPAYRPDGKLLALLERLHGQVVPVNRILLIFTGEEGYRALLAENGMTGESFAERFPLAELQFIGKDAFDHGGTRDLGMKLCSGADYVLFMTEDAVPCDAYLTQNLLRGLEQPAEEADGSLRKPVAAAYGRQLAAGTAGEAEKYARLFNYPEQSRMKELGDLPELGIKTFFCSNVCAMYRRDLYEKIGGFPLQTPFNEDMIYAGHAVQAGYRIWYAADAMVLHSHDLSPVQQFHRNFDLGVSQADHPEVFGQTQSVGEGKKLVAGTVRHLLKKGRILQIPYFAACCAGRYLGYRKGKAYRKLSEKQIMRYTANPKYWQRRFASEQKPQDTE